MIKGLINFAIIGTIFILFCGIWLNKVEAQSPTKVEQKKYHLNLDALDNIKEIIHWEIWNDTLLLYTQQDSIRDEIKRYKYIDSLEQIEPDMIYSRPTQ